MPGIGPDRTRKISAAWGEQKQVKQIMVFLHSHGVSTNLAVKIYKTYGEAALETVHTEARLVFALNEMTNDGHVYAPRDVLAQRAVELLEVDLELISPELDRLASEGRIRSELVPLGGEKPSAPCRKLPVHT